MIFALIRRNFPARICYLAFVMETKSGTTSHAVITREFAQTLAACVEELLPSGHIAVVFEMSDSALADDISNALGVEKFKISRFSYADDTPASHEAAEDVVQAPESIRLLICAGNNIADITKLAAKKKGVPWILCPSGPDILPAAQPFAAAGWGALYEYAPADAPYAIVADEERMKNCSGRDRAAAYASLYAQRLHCAENACENLLFGKNETDAQALADICAQALQEADDLAQYSLKAALEKQKCGLEGEGGARRLARTVSAVSDDGRSVSENCFVCTRVLTDIYRMTLSYTGADIFIPPDRAACAAALGRLCGGDKISLISKLQCGGDFERTAYVMEEYRADMCAVLDKLKENEKIFARNFRRMYEDAGFWLGKYVRPSDLIYIAALSLPLMGRTSLAGAVADKGLINLLF